MGLIGLSRAARARIVRLPRRGRDTLRSVIDAVTEAATCRLTVSARRGARPPFHRAAQTTYCHEFQLRS